MQYIGEHLWVGQLGFFAIFLAFVSALLAGLAYGIGVKKTDIEQKQWKLIGKIAFGVHSIAVFAAIGLIFHLMINRYYEYEYAWAHVSDDLPFRYIFSAFWEGQEGSFLLWIFWNAVLGLILMVRAKKWEMPVMAVVAMVQVCLVSMVLGLHFGADDVKFGVSPFVLLRDVHFAPIFNTATYLDGIKGTGLNPLLQNYWMTIHPPTLFLGFASTVVPFAYAIAGLWTKQYKEWIKAVMPWALFSGAILGTGILMGGAWAYEALSFGGYWAWDPVENASLVPWIIMVAGIHTALIARKTGYSIKSTYVFFILSFFMIVYSTFLTRSGILGETSVHAFTEMGLEWQLVGFLFVILLPPFILYFIHRKNIPAPDEEESLYSKEFWMFIGTIVLLFSSGLITATTSIPAVNAVLGTEFAPPENEVEHHNQFQLWIGVLVTILSGLTQFMRYKVTSMGVNYWKHFSTHLLGSAILAIAVGIPIMMASGIVAWQYWLLVISGWFAVFTNLDYFIFVLRGKVSISGSAVSHIGFGLLMIGVVFSGALKAALSDPFASEELSGILGGMNKQSNQNVLVPKGQTISLSDGYNVSYTKDWEDGNATYFELLFQKKDEQGNLVDEFTTTPNVLREKLPKGGFKFQSANPNTKHYLGRDIFTLAVPQWAFSTGSAEDEAKKDTSSWIEHQVAMGDTIYTKQHYVVFQKFNANALEHEGYSYKEGDIPVVAELTVHTINSNKVWRAKPLYYIRGNMQYTIPAELPELMLSFDFIKIIPEENKVVLKIKDRNPDKEYVVIQALQFPAINLVWIGSIMTMLGLLMGMWQRRAKKQALAEASDVENKEEEL
ncbi:MAG: cytochrome c biogenesis protein CcsA [Aureispira sp.]|nr:cytochrome c biogenesis protein CcsA [Aureispira sp.]